MKGDLELPCGFEPRTPGLGIWHARKYQWLSFITINPLSAYSTKWSNTLKQFVGKLPKNCLSVFDHFVE